jgi:hypothetical protein
MLVQTCESPSGLVMLQLVISTALKLIQEIYWVVRFYLEALPFLEFVFLVKSLRCSHAVTEYCKLVKNVTMVIQLMVMAAVPHVNWKIKLL